MREYKRSVPGSDMAMADELTICVDGFKRRYENVIYYFSTIQGSSGTIGCIIICTETDTHYYQKIFTMDRVDWIEVKKKKEEKKDEN